MVGERHRWSRQGTVVAAGRHDRRPAVAGNGWTYSDRGAAKGPGAYPGVGAERARRGGRPRAWAADGGRRLSHQALRARRTRREGGGVAAPSGGIARDDTAGGAARA